MGNVIRLANSEAVAEKAAEEWSKAAEDAVRHRGAFTIALSGGTTPEALYRLVASEPYQTKLPWNVTHVFFGDERRVPRTDPESNYRMVYETLLKHVPIPPDNIHPMDGVGLMRASMSAYEQQLIRHFKLNRRELPRFDLFLLGMGEDGHTASIFPGTRAVSDLTNMVLVYNVPQLHVERITLTLPVINNSRSICILVVGEQKAQTLRDVLVGSKRTSHLPVQAVDPTDGTLTWLVDEAAASKLDA